MARRSSAISGQWLQFAATILFAAALTVLLMLGMRRADELQSASSALQLASELSSRPAIVRSELTLLQRGLETTTYVGDPLRNIAAIRESSNEAFPLIEQQLRGARLADQPDVAGPLAVALNRWQSLDRGLEALNKKRSAELYLDTNSGSELTASGKQMKAAVDSMLAAQSQNLQIMGDKLGQLCAMLRANVADNGRSLRSILLGGTGVAALLLGMMLYYAWRARLSAASAASAQRQVANILGTVREGLFLVGRDMRLGETCSASLTQLLRLPATAGLSFEQLLEPLVDQKTMTAALKFLGLLWKDKVHEELIESVNPLSQIEVSFPNSHGGTDTRYLAFSFRRVRGDEASADYLLGVVADVTDRVLLARELEHAKADNDSQASLLLQLLRVDPNQLQSFLATADVAFRKSNAMLTAPGIEQQDLKKKLNGVFRELHAIKGEAAALALRSFVERIHAIEDALSALRGKAALSGNDFLPLVVRLDELMTHVATIQSMQERVASFRLQGAKSPSEAHADEQRDTTVINEPVALEPPPAAPTPAPAAASAPASAPILELLRPLAQEVARAQGRAVRLVARGLEHVPARYSAAVKDICIQMIRNAVVHGIESPQLRAQHGKSAEGTVQISFATDSPEDYLLTIEDDGRGLSYEQIMDKALRQGLLRPQQAMALDRATVYRLIFQPGFSTVDQVSEHAGRGVGLDAVGSLVREHGGKVGVSTVAGQYTRFKVLLPKLATASAAAPSAA